MNPTLIQISDEDEVTDHSIYESILQDLLGDDSMVDVVIGSENYYNIEEI